MSSSYGENLHLTIFGQSHSPAIGMTLEGIPAGEQLDFEALQRFLERRAPGRNAYSTARKEADAPEFLSGLRGDTTCGVPLTAIIRNGDTRSKDYAPFSAVPRPGHADYTANVKYFGYQDYAGGGHFSGRLTAPLCIAGGIAKQILSRQGIEIGAHIRSVGLIQDDLLPLYPSKELFEAVAKKDFPVLNDAKGEEMRAEILKAKDDLDSVGGTVECAVTGMDAGFGGPLFGGIEGRLASALFGIPAVKGVEFGSGFQGSTCRGSENNDAFCFDEKGNVATVTNHCGGILGGISDGMPIVFDVAFKPTPSIGRPQQTVDLRKKEITEITIGGRHDPCITHRAVPVVEAVTALVLLDLRLTERNTHHGNI